MMAAYFGLVPWVVFLPLIGLLLNLLVGKRLGEKGIGLIASLATGLAFVVSIVLALGLAGNPQHVTIHLAEWLSVGASAALLNGETGRISALAQRWGMQAMLRPGLALYGVAPPFEPDEPAAVAAARAVGGAA